MCSARRAVVQLVLQRSRGRGSEGRTLAGDKTSVPGLAGAAGFGLLRGDVLPNR